MNEDELSSWLMYPKVFADYAAAQRRYGPVSVLPTPVFFYGLAPGEEIAVDLEPGKTLVIRLQTMEPAPEDGEVKVFFELNGQPRIIRVPDAPRPARSRRGARPTRPTRRMSPPPCPAWWPRSPSRSARR